MSLLILVNELMSDSILHSEYIPYHIIYIQDKACTSVEDVQRNELSIDGRRIIK